MRMSLVRSAATVVVVELVVVPLLDEVPLVLVSDVGSRDDFLSIEGPLWICS